jgi:hypothetical protein
LRSMVAGRLSCQLWAQRPMRQYRHRVLLLTPTVRRGCPVSCAEATAWGRVAAAR